SLGVSWLTIENTMLEAFWKKLPRIFQRTFNQIHRSPDLDEIPPEVQRKLIDTNLFVVWQNCWTIWHYLNQDWGFPDKHDTGVSFAAEAAALYKKAGNSNILPEETRQGLRRLYVCFETVKWITKSTEQFVNYRTFAESRFVTPVLVATTDTLWNAINV